MSRRRLRKGRIVQQEQISGPPEPGQVEIAARNTAETSAIGISEPIPVPPASAKDLILRMWNSPSWDRTGQAALLVIVLSAAITSILWGIGHAIEPFAAHSTAWTAIGAIAGGGGTSALTMSAARRRDRRRRD